MDGQTPTTGLQKVQTTDLVLGMYVAELDRPWLESPFPIQGFYVRSDMNIRKLAEQCAFVYVDPRRYDTRIVDVNLKVVPATPTKSAPPSNVVRLASARPSRPKIYSDSVEVREELVPAQTSLEDAVDVMKSVVDKLRNTGGIEIEEIEQTLLRHSNVSQAAVGMTESGTTNIGVHRLVAYIVSHSDHRAGSGMCRHGSLASRSFDGTAGGCGNRTHGFCRDF